MQNVNFIFEAVVRKLVADCPDCVYDAKDGPCRYASGQCSNNSVGCIIGQALAIMGHDVKLLDSEDLVLSAGAALNELSAGFSIGLRDWATGIQDKQDNGHPWAEALSYADSKRANI